MEWRSSLWSVVSGDHTRTIQIATPTVGGLMKFAVKTITCLGCKTPLRATNSVKSKSRLLTSPTPRLIQTLSQMVPCVTTVDRVWLKCTTNKSRQRQIYKSDSRVYGHNVSGVKDHCIRYAVLPFRKKGSRLNQSFPGCVMHE